MNFQEVAHSVAERDSRHHTQKMQKHLQEIRDHLRAKGLLSISGDEIDGPCVVRASNGVSAYVTDCANKSSLILRPQPTP